MFDADADEFSTRAADLLGGTNTNGACEFGEDAVGDMIDVFVGTHPALKHRSTQFVRRVAEDQAASTRLEPVGEADRAMRAEIERDTAQDLNPCGETGP